MNHLSNLKQFSTLLFTAWLVILVLLFVPPNEPPPSASPSGVGLCRGAPVHYATPASLSARLGQHSGPIVMDGGAPPWPASGDYGSWPDTGADYTDDHEALTYEERFSADALGDWAWAEAACLGCTVSQGAVKEQGVGE